MQEFKKQFQFPDWINPFKVAYYKEDNKKKNLKYKTIIMVNDFVNQSFI